MSTFSVDYLGRFLWFCSRNRGEHKENTAWGGTSKDAGDVQTKVESVSTTSKLETVPVTVGVKRTWICFKVFFVLFAVVHHHGTTIWENIFRSLFPGILHANPR